MDTPGIFRLIRTAGPQIEEEWTLGEGGAVTLGRFDTVLGIPDVDLAPDRTISRRHARMWVESGRWRIEDLGSNKGTAVAGILLHPGEVRCVEPGADIHLGDTELVLLAPGWRRLRGAGLAIEIGPTAAFGLAAHEGGAAPLRHLAVQSASPHAQTSHALVIRIQNVGQTTALVPPLAPGERRQLPLSGWQIDADALLGRVEPGWQAVTLAVDGVDVPAPDLGTRILAHNEWAGDVDSWTTLAAYALPNHPLVARLASGLSREPAALLDELYGRLAQGWHIDYVHEPPHHGAHGQKIRLPHHLLTDLELRRGAGTCLDLALLFAAVLEHCGAQPLVAIVARDGARHALAGCWSEGGGRIETIRTDPDHLGTALWLDPNGVTRDPVQRSELADGRATAAALLASGGLVFVLDIAAARADGIAPLPIDGEPRLSAAVEQVIAAAAAAAGRCQAAIGTVPLLIGLLQLPCGVTRGLVANQSADPDGLAAALADGLTPSPAGTVRSRHFDETMACAFRLAREEHAAAVDERHLAVALGSIESVTLWAALTSIGLDRALLLSQLDGRVPGPARLIDSGIEGALIFDRKSRP